MIDIRRFGATGLLSQDATTQIQNAVNATAGSGAALYVPRGVYRTTSPITNISGKAITIEGDGVAYDTTVTGTRGDGSWFYFDHLGVGMNLYADGITIKSVGSFRNQTPPATPWTPIAASYDWYFGGGDIFMDDIMIYNSSRGVAVAGTARCDLNRVRGQCSDNFIFLDQILDTSRITNCHYYTFWTGVQGVTDYQVAHATVLELRRVDNPHVSNLFGILANKGIHFNVNTAGPTPGGVSRLLGNNIGFDAVYNGLYYDTSSADVGAWITNIYCSGISLPSTGAGIRMQGSGNRLYCQNLETVNQSGPGVSIEGTNNRARLTFPALAYWDRLGVGFPALSCEATNYLDVFGTPEFTNSAPGLGVTYGGAGAINHTYT